MRDILFRGKTTRTKLWVYGYYTINYGTGRPQIREKADCCFKEVLPETVGQYTGLTDKNGNRIFEGDIVDGLFRFHKPVNSVVAYSEGSFGLLWDRGGVETFWAFPTICNVEYEVIGNIHDNPELLKGGEGVMTHTGKWRRLCGIQKSQECYNCSNKKKIIETKDKIVVVCDIGYVERTLEFSKHLTPYCGAYTSIPKERGKR